MNMNLHHTPGHFQAIDGELALGGHPVSYWVKKFGRTPLFLYDQSRIEQKITQVKAAFPSDLSVRYAIKANPMPDLVRFMASRIDGFDVASAGELKLALMMGMDPQRIGFAGPGKRYEEMEQAVQAGVTVHMESERQVACVGEIARKHNCRARAALRVNPPFVLKGAGMHMGGKPSAFGVDAQRIPGLVKEVLRHPIDFTGFHFFCGSQSLSEESLLQSYQHIVDLVTLLSKETDVIPQEVNLGGGLGVPYFSGDKDLDLSVVGQGLSDILHKRSPLLRQTRFILELGRYLVADSGVYVTQVLDVKDSYGETFVIVDGGLHHQLAASGNFGTVIRRNYPVINASCFTMKPSQKVQLVGCLCTPLDFLGRNVVLPTTKAGDLVAVFMAGAYGLTAIPVRFLSHAEPLERMI